MISPASRFAIVLLCLVQGCILRAQAPAPSTPAPAGLPRTWTTSDGRAFQATLVNVQGTQIVLKMPTGQLATVPLMRLSLGEVLTGRQDFSISQLVAVPLNHAADSDDSWKRGGSQCEFGSAAGKADVAGEGGSR